MASKKLLQTFISYSRINQQFAIKLACELKSAGFSIWMDQFDIPTGARWDDEIEKALRECEIFLLIITPASISSENAKDELGYAIDHGKYILPVLLEDCTIPLRLRRFQYVDFTQKNFQDGIHSAKELLSRLVDDIEAAHSEEANQSDGIGSQNKSIPVTDEPKTKPSKNWTTSHQSRYAPIQIKNRLTKLISISITLAAIGALIIFVFVLNPRRYTYSPSPTLLLPTSTQISVTPTIALLRISESTIAPVTLTPEVPWLFMEEFDSDSRWNLDWNLQFRHGDISKQNKFKAQIDDDKLTFDLTDEFVWGYFFYDTSILFDQVEIEVVVEDLRSTDTLGLVCQYSALGWYEFDVNGGGEYWVRYVDNMESQFDEQRYELKFGTIPSFKYSIIETQENTIKIICSGNSLSLQVNGAEIFKNYINSIYDLEQGTIGIAARSYETYPVNFVVKSITVKEP